jgi:Putative Actinobacterial Holin-X, holin superfamily III
VSTAAEPGGETTRPSVGELMTDVATDLSTLMRQEIELAKAEVRQSALQAGRGAGLLAGAGVSVHMFLVFASVAVWWGLGDAIGHGWSGLIVGGIWLLIAAVLGLMGRRELSSVSGLPQTQETVKKIPGAVKGNEARS